MKAKKGSQAFLVSIYNEQGIQQIGLEKLIDREDKKVKEHPACYYNQESLLISAIQEAPWLLRTPLVRNGNKMTVGYCPDVWEQWS